MNSYLTSITAATAFFPILSLLIAIPFMVKNYHEYGSISKLRFLIVYSFVLYLLIAYFLTIMPLPSRDYVANLTTARYNLNIFRGFYDFKVASGFDIHDISTYISCMKSPTFYQPVFNILLMIPFGIYLRYYYQCSLKKTVFFTFLLSMFFELTQLTGLYFIYPRSYRMFDVDDLLFNTIGGINGYWLGKIVIKFLPSRDEIDSNAYNESKKITGFRRLTALLMDYLIYVVVSSVTILIYIFMNYKIQHYTTFIIQLVVAFLIFIFVPFVTDGRTFGKMLTQIKTSNLDDSNCKRCKVFFRSLFVYIILIVIPHILRVDFVTKYVAFDILLIIVYCLYLIFSFFLVLKRKRLWYEKITFTKNTSTIELVEE
jgi:glycopeptide antibiotics resistance protein